MDKQTVCLAVRRKKPLTHNSRGAMLSGRNQTGKAPHCVIPFIRKSGELLFGHFGKGRAKGIEKGSVVFRSWGEDGGDYKGVKGDLEKLMNLFYIIIVVMVKTLSIAQQQV